LARLSRSVTRLHVMEARLHWHWLAGGSHISCPSHGRR
jgi:hypothetical protein